MAWDFCTDPDVQARLDWADRFVAEEIEPIESLLYDVVDVGRPEGSIAELFEQWRQEVKDQPGDVRGPRPVARDPKLRPVWPWSSASSELP